MELKTTFQKLNEEIKSKIQEQLKSKEIQEVIAKIKEAQDSGKFEVVISTGDVDRMEEIISPEGWDLKFYKNNPVVLWAHNYEGLPIGITESIEIKEGKLMASGKFAPADANPLAQQIRKLYDLKIQRATSVGFIEKEKQGNNIVKAELLEWSFVPVPANPFCLSTLKNSGVDTMALITKGIIMPVKEEPKEGDSCTLEDNTEGEYEKNNDGELVCVPKKGTKPEPDTEGDYIIIRVKDPDYFDPDSFRTIDISEEKGIKATIGCKKGEYEEGKCQIGTEVQRYLFDKEKWTLEEAEAWMKENEKGQKGAVQDVSEQMKRQKEKWEKINPIWDIFDAFLGVYLDGETDVESFGELLSETVELMKKYIPEGTASAKGIVEGAIGKTKQEGVEEVGAILTKMQSEIDAAIVTYSKNIIELLGKKQNAILKNIKLQGDKPGDEAKLGREPAGLKELEEFLSLRQILQIIDRTCEDGLKKIKVKIRSSQK